jgi:hypothetical protein
MGDAGEDFSSAFRRTVKLSYESGLMNMGI